MALSTANGFRFRKNLISSGASPEPIQFRMANSQTVHIGDAIRVNASGFALTSGVSNPIAGVCIGIVDDNGINPFSLVYDTTATGVTLAPSNPGTEDGVTTSSTNQTSTHYISVEVAVDPAGVILFYNLANGALSVANLLEFYNLTAAGNQVDTGTASNTTGVMQLVQLDPDGDGNTSKGLFKIAINQMADFISNSTAVRT